MQKKILLSLLVIVALFTITGCVKNTKNKGSSETLIKLVDKKDKGYVTTFKVKNDFTQPDLKYNHVDNEKLGIFITFDYIESSKEAYDYAKTHNFLGREYAEGEVKEYKWNNYDGYFYNINENEMYFRILLEDNPENSIVLSAYVGPKNKDVDLTKIADNEDFQNFLNSIEFKKEK